MCAKYVTNVSCSVSLQDEAMSGCTDGLSLHNMVRYFRCPPGRAYFCLLSCLENEKSFIFERMGSSPNSATGNICYQKELVIIFFETHAHKCLLQMLHRLHSW